MAQTNRRAWQLGPEGQSWWKSKTHKQKKIQKKSMKSLGSHVTCNLSPAPTATATDPVPNNSPIMQSRLFQQDPKQYPETKKSSKLSPTKGVLSFAILAIRSWTRGLQLSRFRLRMEGTTTHPQETDIATYRLNRPMGRFSENGSIRTCTWSNEPCFN